MDKILNEIRKLDQENFDNFVSLIHIEQAERARRIIGKPPFPEKSYLDDDTRFQLLRSGSLQLVCLAEAQSALFADDEDSYLKWMSCAKLSARTLKMLKDTRGIQVLKNLGFDFSNAVCEYGEQWLD